MDWIGGVLLCFFLLLGILVGLRKLLYMILGDNSGTLCLTLYFCGHVENAEQQLRSALEELRWMEGRRKRSCCALMMGWMRKRAGFAAALPEIIRYAVLSRRKSCRRPKR